MPLAGRLRCEAGELLALVGPSGAGKTSMLRLMAGLLKPEQARVQVGTDLWCDTAQGLFVPPQRRSVGLVFQNYALMPHLSARDNVALSLLHLPHAQRLLTSNQWLDHVGLDASHQARRPSALSGGQQQRVSVARALARKPRLLLLDEPFSAVDQMNRQGLYRLLADLRRELNIPIVLVTHDLNEARLLADRLVVMDGGQVLQSGTPRHIHQAPRNARVANLVGIQNRFKGRWLGPAAEQGSGLLQWLSATPGDATPVVFTVVDKGRLPTGHDVTWVIPNDGITLMSGGDLGPTDLEVEVIEARHLGEITLATFKLLAMPDTPLVLTLTGAQRQTLDIGSRCVARLDPQRIHVMPWRKEHDLPAAGR